MSWTDYRLEVLACNPIEINQITERLKQPSTELVNRIAERSGQPASEIAAGLKELVEFKIENLYDVDEDDVDKSVSKTRRFWNSCRRYGGIVVSHLYEISEEFPSAIFLLEGRYEGACASSKTVIRAGELIREVVDDHQVQFLDWVLLDIFAPFRAEYEIREAREHGAPPREFKGALEFGSLWNQWVDDVIAAAKSLKEINAAEQQEGSL